MQSYRTEPDSRQLAKALLLTRRGWLLLILLGLFGSCLANSARAQVQATIERSTVAVGETVQLTVTVDGLGLKTWPAVPQISGLKITPGGASQNSTIVNGVKSDKVVLTYMVTAVREGSYNIPPISVAVNGKVTQTQPIIVRVVPAGSTPTSQMQDKQAVLQLSVPKTEYYLGEVFPVEMMLYFQNAKAEYPQLKSEGFSLSSPPQHAQDRVRIGNTLYQQHTFRYLGKALKTGDLTLGPATCNLELRIPIQSNDPFANGFFQRYQTQPLTATSEPSNLKILPLPEDNVPAGFNGAIGQFEFQAQANKTSVQVGDPITLSIQIKGIGAWDAVQLPPMDDWRDFKVYPPNNQFTPSDDLGMQGVKTFEIVVVPENSGVKEIPELAFSYFDPDKRSYQTIKQAAVPLVVKADSATPVQPTVTSGVADLAKNEPPPVKDILHIKPHLGTIALPSSAVIVRPWFWGVNSLPLLAWASLIWWRKREERLARDPKAQRARQVAEAEAKGIEQLQVLALGGSSEEFFNQLTKLLQERLGERLDLPASAITESVVTEKLEPAGLDDALCTELRALFQVCNQARYASMTDTAELDALKERAAALLQQLTVWEAAR